MRGVRVKLRALARVKVSVTRHGAQPCKRPPNVFFFFQCSVTPNGHQPWIAEAAGGLPYQINHEMHLGLVVSIRSPE